MSEPKEFSGYIQRDERLEFEDMNAQNAERERIIQTIENIRRTFTPEPFVNEQIAAWHLAEIKRIIEPLKKLDLKAGTAIEVSTLNMGNILTAVQSTLKRANEGE